MIACMPKASKSAAGPALIGINACGLGFTSHPPTRDPITRELIFEGAPTFRPNMTPSEASPCWCLGRKLLPRHILISDQTEMRRSLA